MLSGRGGAAAWGDEDEALPHPSRVTPTSTTERSIEAPPVSVRGRFGNIRVGGVDDSTVADVNTNPAGGIRTDFVPRDMSRVGARASADPTNLCTLKREEKNSKEVEIIVRLGVLFQRSPKSHRKPRMSTNISN